MSGATERIAVIGDVHLDLDDAALPDFLHLLDALGRRAGRIVLMGDLFNLWIGRSELNQPHHDAVLDRLRELRRRGITLFYVEGNRDYRIAPAWAGDAFDAVAEDTLELVCGTTSLLFAHGDRVNAADRQYLLWRRISRSPLVWALFHAVPRFARQRLALAAERRMRGTNLAFKGAFPEAAVQRYAATLLRDGAARTLVLGHFHLERSVDAGAGRRVFVLPEWKGTRRHLELAPDAEPAFRDAGDV